MELFKSILRKIGLGKKDVEKSVETKVDEVKIEKEVKVEAVSIPENKSVIKEEQTKVAKPEPKKIIEPTKPVAKTKPAPANKAKRKYNKKPNS